MTILGQVFIVVSVLSVGIDGTARPRAFARRSPW